MFNPAEVHAYWEGVASRQAEIDELQKRIDEALNILSQMRHNGAYRVVCILKGNQND